MSASGVADNSEDLVLDITFNLKHAVQDGHGDILSVNMPSIWTGYYLSARIVPDRQNPFTINYPFEITLTTELEKPDEYQLTAPILAAAEKGSPYLDWHTGSSGPEHGRFYAALKPGEFSAAAYADYVEKADAAVKAARLEFSMERIPESAGQLSKTDP